MKYEKLSKKDFDWINWTPSQIKKLPAQIKEERQKRIDAILAVPKDERTFENTVIALDNLDKGLKRKSSYVHVLQMLSPKKTIRDASVLAEIKINQDYQNQIQNEDLYEALKEFKFKKSDLSVEETKLIKDFNQGFERMGFNLSKEKRKELKNIQSRKSKVQSQYMQALNEYSDAVVLKNEKDLIGLPGSYLETLKKDKNKNFLVSLAYPEYRPFMSYSENEEKRKELHLKNTKKGGKRALNLFNKIVDLTWEESKIRGYKNPAEFILENRMVGNVKTANSFQENIAASIRSQAKAELSILKKEKKKNLGERAKLFGPHDVSFYANKIKERELQLKDEEVRKFFPTDFTVPKILDLFGSLYGFTWKKSAKNLWHKDAELIEVYKGKNMIGYVGLDLYPRAGKYGHACMIPMHPGFYDRKKKERLLGMTTLVMNFRKGKKNQPSTMSVGEVLTFMHELGHGLHLIMSGTTYASQSGTNVKWDFVEVPSQLQENWLYEPKVLKKLSSHIEDGKNIDSRTIRKIIESRNFMEPFIKSRQIAQGIFDMDVYTKRISDPVKHFGRVLKKYTGLSEPEKSLFPGSFKHIVTGYQAGYHTYLWSEVYADDIFSEFKKEGVTNKKVGRRYVKEILSRGSSRDELESVKAFLGRKPNNKAFLKKLGIK